MRRFASTITGLAAIEGEAEWKRAPQTIRRLDALVGQLAELGEAVLGRALIERIHERGEVKTPGLEPGDAISEPITHTGPRQLARLERQMGVLWRQLENMTCGGLLTSAPAIREANLPEAKKVAESR